MRPTGQALLDQPVVIGRYVTSGSSLFQPVLIASGSGVQSLWVLVRQSVYISKTMGVERASHRPHVTLELLCDDKTESQPEHGTLTQSAPSACGRHTPP